MLGMGEVCSTVGMTVCVWVAVCGGLCCSGIQGEVKLGNGYSSLGAHYFSWPFLTVTNSQSIFSEHTECFTPPLPPMFVIYCCVTNHPQT